jgi:Ni/Fe-hydrogenase subunit HybB-like protein
MTSPSTTPAKPGFKKRAENELKDYALVSGYLAVLFCAVAAYTQLLLRKYGESSTLNYTFAIINALVIGKVILIGDMMHLGRRAETRPLYQTVIFKSLAFGLFIFAFHLVEEFIKRLIHHEPAGTVLHQIELTQLISRAIVILCALFPLFAFRELPRYLGEGKLHEIFFSRTPPGRATP